MSSIYNVDNLVFGSNENAIKNSDDNILNNILEELCNYDVLDFICRVSSLNLIPYNQNKSFVFDNIIDHLLRSEITLSSNGNKMSPRKFKQLVNSGSNLNIAIGIDPIEMPFMQRVQFYGNKWIFSGINSHPAYTLQHFIDILFKNTNHFNHEFLSITNRIIHLTLEVSTKIAERIQYTKDVYQHHENKDIVYPNTEDSNRFSQALIFDENDFGDIFDEDFRKLIYYSVDISNKYEITPVNCSFYYNPFLKIDSNKFIVLNPSMLAPFTIYNIIYISSKYGYKDEVVDLYNNKIWCECAKSLYELGHKRINTTKLGIELINTDYYKEAIFNVSNDGLLFVSYFCDNARDYDFSNMSTPTRINISSVENRWREIREAIVTSKKEKFYQLTLINSLGRGVNIPYKQKPYHKNVIFSPYELSCISINENSHPNFLLHYIESKQHLNISSGVPIPEINYLTVYVNNNYSFYIGDDINLKTTFFWVGFGDSVDYLNKALLTQDKQLSEIPGSNYFEEIVLNDAERNIYCTTNHNSFALMNKFKNIDIWVSADLHSPKELNLIYSVLDLITYWLSDCKSIIESNNFRVKSVLIKNHFLGNLENYYLDDNSNDSCISTYLSSSTNEEIINIYWSPEAFLCLANRNNKSEKDLIEWTLTLISSFTVNKFNFHHFHELFSNPLKTKIFALDYSTHPYFKPISKEIRYIPVEYENQLLDEIGNYLRNTKKLEYGIIQSTEKHLVCNDIVEFLYKKLQSKVKEFNSIGFYEQLHYDLERIIYSLMLTQKRYAYDKACYPEQIQKIDKNYNEINKSSIATKFLLEYVAAIPPSGSAHLGELDYEYMLTICSLIIEWAHNSDMFKYKMISNDLEILDSGRIGLKKDKIDELSKNHRTAMLNRLTAISNPYIDIYTPLGLISSSEFNLCFEDEFTYSYTELNACMAELIAIGDTFDSEVKRIKFDSACDMILEKTAIPKDKIIKILNDMSLCRRDSYLSPPPPFTALDVHPWRFNRKLSFIRRPITMVEDDLIWGNRQLYHSLQYLYDLIISGKLAVREHGKLKSYLGKLTNARGNNFNDIVAKKIKTFPSVMSYPKIKKINKNRILDKDGNDLGDIDVLVILPEKKKIIVIEVKDFSFAKTPYEMHQQYLDIFQDKGKKLCYISKHKKRVAWIKDHIYDIIEEYNLQNENWKVVDALVVDESIISNEFYHQNQNIILYSNLTEETLKRIK